MKILALILLATPLSGLGLTIELMSISITLAIPTLWFSWFHPTAYMISIATDKTSSILVLLTAWMALAMLMMTTEIQSDLNKLTIMTLAVSLTLFFSVTSLLMFFVLFEASLIPTLVLIIGWGYQPERLEASYYFIFYTAVFSIPLLASMIWLVMKSGSNFIFSNHLISLHSSLFTLLILLVFAIKLPLFMCHFWLPKAHVEAPVVGSMILAGVLLKTGGYGVLRLFTQAEMGLVVSLILSLAALGMVYICLVCLYCVDLKQIIAYSSVSHMNFMMAGMMLCTSLTYSGGLIMMVSHGLCSSLMFVLVDFMYKRSGSRSLILNKGYLMLTPSLALWWALTSVLNMSFPPTLGSISELIVIMTLNKALNNLMLAPLLLYLFLSAFYSVFIYVTTSHGIPSLPVSGGSLSMKESLVALLLVTPLLGLIFVNKLMLL